MFKFLLFISTLVLAGCGQSNIEGQYVKEKRNDRTLVITGEVITLNAGSISVANDYKMLSNENGTTTILVTKKGSTSSKGAKLQVKSEDDSIVISPSSKFSGTWLKN